MSENLKSIQDGFVLPSEGQIADRPHRAYDVEVGQKTYEWLKQTPDCARIPFVPLGNIPREAVGYLTRGDGPKAVLNIQDDTRTLLPRAIGIPEGKPLKSSPSDKDVDDTFEAETISRRETVAKKIVDFICGELLKLQGDDLDNFVKKGLKMTVPQELVSDVGFDATFVPCLGKGIADGWVPNSQDAGTRRRHSWFSSLSGSVYAGVKKFIVDTLHIQTGKLEMDTKNYYSRMIHTDKFTPDLLDQLCCVGCKCDGNGSFIVDISFSPGNLNHPVFSLDTLSSSEQPSAWTETKWTTPPGGVTWKQPLGKAA